MRFRLPLIALIASSGLMLSACYESQDVTRYEPGVYKGKEDPLVSKLESDAELREQLDQRFDGQRDR